MARIEVDAERCKGCELCIVECPCQAIAMSESFNSSGYYHCVLVKPEDCKGCGLCALVCPDMAIEVFREEKSK